MNERVYNTDLTVKCIIWEGNYLAICSRTENEKNSSVATSIQQPRTQKQRDIPYGCPQVCAAAALLIIQYTTLKFRKSKAVTVRANKPYRGGVEVWLHSFLTSALDGGEWSASQTR